MRKFHAVSALALALIAASLSGCKGLTGSKYTDANLQAKAKQKEELEKRKTSTCNTPWGETVEPGESVTAFKEQTACEQACEALAIERKCENGVLTGENSYMYKECAPNVCHSCKLPWGGLVAHGAEVEAFKSDERACGENCAEASNRAVRKCVDGTLSGAGEYNLGSCTVKKCACPFPWNNQEKMPDGTTVVAYDAPQVECRESCDTRAIALTCVDGVTKGPDSNSSYSAFTNEVCKVKECKPCSWAGNPVSDGGTVTGFAKELAGPKETCASSPLTCKNGVFEGVAQFPASRCKKQCGLDWTNSDGNPQTLVMNPGDVRQVYRVNKVGCHESSASKQVQVRCDPAGSGTLQPVGAGSLPAQLYAEAPQVCKDCTWGAATVRDGDKYQATLPGGSKTSVFYDVSVGNCAATCSDHSASFYCDGGTMKSLDGASASEDMRLAFSQTACRSDCVTCAINFADGTKATLAKDGLKAISALEKVLSCDQTCEDQQAIVKCVPNGQDASGNVLGKLVIESANNKSLTVADLKYPTCKKPEGIRCSSGGNPPRACSFPGEFWSGEHGQRIYQPRMDRHTYLSLSDDPIFGRAVNPLLTNYLQVYQLGDPATRKDAPKVPYGAHPPAGDNSSWMYMVSPDSQITFYDTPEVDPNVVPGDNCDKHAAGKRCDPDGYWLLEDEKTGNRGGMGPALESLRSSKYKYTSCVTKPVGKSTWSSRRKIVPDCLAQVRSGMPGACIFPKNPYYANGSRPTYDVSKDSLQNLWIDWMENPNGPTSLSDDSFRVIELRVGGVSICRPWSAEFTELEREDLAAGKKTCEQISKSAMERDIERRPFLSNVVFSNQGPEIYLPAGSLGQSAFAPATINYKFKSTQGWQVDPVTGGKLVPDLMKASYSGRNYPGLALMVYYQLHDAVELLSERVGPSGFYARYKNIEVYPGDGALANNAAFSPMSGFYRRDTGRDALSFGPTMRTLADPNEILGFRYEFGESWSYDTSVVAHELGHANLFLGSRINPFSAYSNCPSGVGSCCADSSGCYLAIHEGQADYTAAMLFPDSPALGDGITESPGGLGSGLLSRDPRSNRNVTFEQAFAASDGEIHGMGSIYASMWWELRSSRPEGERVQVDRLFMEHLKYLVGGSNFVAAYDAVRVAEQRLFGDSRTYSDFFLSEINRRKGGSAIPPDRTLASEGPTVTAIPDLTVRAGSGPISITFDVSQSANVVATSLTPSLLPQASLGLSAGVQLLNHYTLTIAPTSGVGTGQIQIVASYLGKETKRVVGYSQIPETAPNGVSDHRELSLDLNTALAFGLPLDQLFGSGVHILGLKGRGVLRGNPPVFFPEIGDLGTVVFWVQSAGGQITEVTIDLNKAIHISTPAELALLTENPYGRFELAQDLVLTGVPISPVGVSPRGYQPFRGNFDGMDHKITGLTITGQTEGYLAWFPTLMGKIENLKIEHAFVAGNALGVGGVAGLLVGGGLISGVEFEGTVAGGWSQGGIAAEVEGKIKKSKFTGKLLPLALRSSTGALTIPATDASDLAVAGLIGWNTSSKPLSLASTAAVDGSGNELPYVSTIAGVRNRVHVAGAYLSGKAQAQILTVPADLENRIASTVFDKAGAITSLGNIAYPGGWPYGTFSAQDLYCGASGCRDVDFTVFEARVNTGSEEHPVYACGLFYQPSGISVSDQVSSPGGWAVLELASDQSALDASPADRRLAVGGIAGKAIPLTSLEQGQRPFQGYDNAGLVKESTVDADTLVASAVTRCGNEPVQATVAVLLPSRQSESEAPRSCSLAFAGAVGVDKIEGCAEVQSAPQPSPSSSPSNGGRARCESEDPHKVLEGSVDGVEIPSSSVPNPAQSTLPIAASFSGSAIISLTANASRSAAEAYYSQNLIRVRKSGTNSVLLRLVLGTAALGDSAHVTGLPAGIAATVSCP